MLESTAQNSREVDNNICFNRKVIEQNESQTDLVVYSYWWCFKNNSYDLLVNRLFHIQKMRQQSCQERIG